MVLIEFCKLELGYLELVEAEVRHTGGFRRKSSARIAIFPFLFFLVSNL